MLTLGTGVGGGIVIDDRLYRGWAELGHIGRDRRGPAVPGELPRPRASRGARLGTCRRPCAPRSCTDATPTRRSPRRGRERATSARSTRSPRSGGILGAAIGSWVNIFDPDIVVVGGGFGAAAGDLLLEPARAIGAGRGDPARRRDTADRRGGARRRGRSDRRRARRVRGARRAAVTLAPLRDADRQPRRRDAARARGARGRRHRPLRGHTAHARSCSSGTASRARLLSLPPAQRGGARRRARAAARRGRAHGARLGRRAPWRQRPRRAARRRGARGRRRRDGAARAVRGRDGSRRQRARGRAVPVPRLPPAVRTGAGGALAGARRPGRHPTVAFESPKRLSATLASLAAADPDRPVAVCRELTKLHEEVVVRSRPPRSPSASARRRRARSRS